MKYTRKHLLTFVALNSVVVLIYWVIVLNTEASSGIQLKSAYLKTILKPTSATLSPTTSFHRHKKNTKYILYWSPMWDSKTFSFGAQGFELFEHCQYKNCFATHDKKLISIEDFHAIVFHAAQYTEKLHGKPKKRKPHQRYIFATLESPTRAYPENLHKFKSFFNWTMTYRYDSDIIRPYGRVIKRTINEYVMPQVDYVKNKTRLVAWFVSNCHTINRREEVYKNLRQYVDIDVYGTCGKLNCPKELHESSNECYDLIENKYKFYLSFENSHCIDYATEKLYRLLERNIVPIVYGNNDYKKITPPHSVIVAENYPSAKELADYLLFLDTHLQEYLKYFEWKKNYIIERSEKRTACNLCKLLNDRLQPNKVYTDIFLWWLGSNHSNCVLGDGLPNISVPNK